MFFDYNKIKLKLENNNRIILVKILDTRKLNKTLLKNQWVKEKNSRKLEMTLN